MSFRLAKNQNPWFLEKCHFTKKGVSNIKKIEIGEGKDPPPPSILP
jgi:hypothetical protein